MNALIHENNGGEQRMPHVSTCETLVSEGRESPWRVPRTKIQRFTRDERKVAG